MRTLLNISSLSIVLLLSISACNKRPETKDAPAAAATATPAPTQAYAVGDKAQCPVTNEAFTVTASTVQVEYEGKHYAFCCADCQPAFTKNPAKYAKK